MLLGLLIIMAGATVLSVFPVKDRSSSFGMLVIRSRWILLIVGGSILALAGLVLMVGSMFAAN